MSPPAFSRIGLIAKPGDPRTAGVLERVAGHLTARGVKLLMDSSSQPPGLSLPAIPIAEFAGRCDAVLAIGGDGTLLGAARNLAGTSLPLAGINLGRLGFLADVSPGELPQRLDELLAGQFIPEQRALLDCAVLRQGAEAYHAVALNDVVLHKWELARMIEFSVRANGLAVATYRADGIVVATPTGSTAYSLSAGGPIVHPDLDVLVLAPICPHTLNNRPLVIGGGSVLHICPAPGFHEHSLVTLDGQTWQRLQAGDEVRVTRYARRLTLLHPPGYHYYDTLRAKLNWNAHQI
jgi:NAD+ kinase